jgi:hypothetical protein
MNGTFFARRFVFPEFAIFQTAVGIIFQLPAIRAKRFALPVPEAAVNTQHFGNCFFLAVIH